MRVDGRVRAQLLMVEQFNNCARARWQTCCARTTINYRPNSSLVGQTSEEFVHRGAASRPTASPLQQHSDTLQFLFPNDSSHHT